MSDTIASWNVSLDCECPKCKESVNLLDYADFWDSRSKRIEIGESKTPATTDMEVICPECGYEFTVDCEY